jgi:hypothetical protein
MSGTSLPLSGESGHADRAMEPPDPDLTADLLAAGNRYLADLGPAFSAADPEGLVSPRSRLLCAALGLLAEETYRALGGRRRAGEVGRAAAMLSLLTKVDDQVIDALPFHGGSLGDRGGLRARTRAYLAPTLDSVRAARPATGEPRCAFAAALGQAIRALGADAARRERLLSTLAAGWEIQVEAVAVLTAHPDAVTREEVARVTRSISGAWLLMIAMVGTLPDDAARALSPAEEDQFFAWGWAIQRTDALADLGKDLADGHLSSWPGLLLWERAGEAYLDAARRGDAARVYALVRAHGVDGDVLPGRPEIAALGCLLGGLGEVPALLAWILRYLSGRYREHPLAQSVLGAASAPQTPPAPPPNPLAADGEVACSAP